MPLFRNSHRDPAKCFAGDESFATIMITKDPRKIYQQPPYSAKEQSPPGNEKEMSPRADHGESSYQGTDRLRGRHALITGADSGIGRAIALAFAREGADIAISYLSEEEDARETERLVTEAGRQAVLLPGDIGKTSVTAEVARKAIEAFGTIDILVNNAAFQRTYEKFEDIPDDEFEETYRVNVFAMFRLCKAILPQMKEGGVIINTGSIQSFDPSPNLIAYASTKAAIVSFTRSLASHAMERGVRVNAVAPGPVWTPLIPSTMPKEKVKEFGSKTIFGRAGQPAEVAPIFVFLASDQASYVTGEVYGATGGLMPL
jgi:NAD(P)-dependent dehydrogenase (short-subunit alcohol dehydrogenase family)